MTSVRSLPLAGVSLLALCTALQAQTSDDSVIVLDAITIVADGQENIEATGGAVITSGDLEVLQPADISELFARESAVSVSGGGGPAKRVSVFGMEQSLLAVSVDGVPQVSTSWHHTGSNVIDPAFLKRVELEAGAAAADAGFAAAAGALRYETVTAPDLLEPGQAFGSRVALSYGSNGRGLSGSVAAYGRHGGLDWLLMVHGAEGDDYKDGSGAVVAGSEPSARNLLAKLGYEFETHRLELSYERSRESADRLIKMNLGLAGDTLHPLEVGRDTVKLSYSSTSPTDSWDPEAVLYFSQNDYWRDNYSPARTNGNMILDEDLFGGQLQNTFTIAQGTVTTGVDFGQHDYHIDNYGVNDRRYRDFSTSQVGAFAQGRFEFGQGFKLSTGARYDAHRFTDWDGNRFTDNGASVNGTLAYKASENVEFFAGASRTWLGYVIGDYAYLHARSDAFVTDPDLRAGEAKNFKIGANFGGDAWRAGITLFDTRIDGLLDYGMTSLGNKPDEYRSKGFTLNASYDFGNTRIGGTFTKADVTAGGVDVLPDNGTYFMPAGEIATLFVDHEIPEHNLKLGATMEWAGSLDGFVRGATTYYEQPSYTVVNVYGEWSPRAHENVSIRLGIDNLFDRTYFERTSFAPNSGRGGIGAINAPGRTVTLGAAMRF